MSTSSTDRPARRLSPQTETGLIAFLAALSGLSAMGIDILLPGLGEIRSAFDLAPDSTRVSLIITVYLFGLGTGQIFFGPIADRFGRRPTVLIGLGMFALGALGSSVSPSLTAMLACRFLMGMGAASPRAMSLAIARDRFSGDAMTRVVSLVMLFFQLSPAIAPLLGEGLVAIGGWQSIFVFSATMAAAVMWWTTRFSETLAAEHRRPLTFARTSESARAIVGSRWALGHGLVLMFEFTAFYVYLSSSELIFDDVFGRGGQFAVFFALGAVIQAAGNLSASRLAPRFGTTTLMAGVVTSYIAAGIVFLVITAGADGHPNFWLWLLLLWTLNGLHALVLTMANSLAMQPLAAFAGTGSGLIGTMSMMGGAIMASLVAATIDGSATPMAAAYCGFGLLAGASLWWARGGSDSPLGQVSQTEIVYNRPRASET
jgi:DHA1 family bicyclomycin/chloramphenicol resistance-like MFS transporter